jgi:hypothetical protein
MEIWRTVQHVAGKTRSQARISRKRNINRDQQSMVCEKEDRDRSTKIRSSAVNAWWAVCLYAFSAYPPRRFRRSSLVTYPRFGEVSPTGYVLTRPSIFRSSEHGSNKLTPRCQTEHWHPLWSEFGLMISMRSEFGLTLSLRSEFLSKLPRDLRSHNANPIRDKCFCELRKLHPDTDTGWRSGVPVESIAGKN